jgi:hypothetical protein
MQAIEENIQIYQLNQDNKIYILSTGLVGQNLKMSCYEHKENSRENLGYSSIFTIEQLRKADPIFQITKDCEDVQSIFEDVLLAESVGIVEGQGILDVYFYMRANERRAKVILRLNWQHNTPPPPKFNEYQKNQERLTRLQYNANQLLNEQNDLRRQLNSFFGDNSDNNNQDSHTRSRSTNQNNYHNQLNEYNITNNMGNMYNNQNNMNNVRRIQVNDEDDNEVYEVPPTNDIVP